MIGYSDSLSTVLDTLAAELERPRVLSTRVINYIAETYSIDRDTIGPFLVDKLSGLEDDEIDLILSPLFTPKLVDQAVFAELLGRDSVPHERWPALTQQLIGRPVRGQLVTSDDRTHVATLREVTIDRYLHRLRLDGTISESLFDLLGRTPAADRPMLKAVTRRAVWDTDARRNLLARYLTAVTGRESYTLTDAVNLLNLVENRKPSDLADLLDQIPRWQQALRQQIDVASNPKAFFSNRVQAEHGGERDQRRQDDGRMSLKQDELAFLDRLQQALSG